MAIAPRTVQAESVRRNASKAAGKAATKPADATPSTGDCLEDTECRQTFESARRLSESRQYNAALDGYEKAYAMRPSPWLLINIGRVQQKMGRPADAISSFNRFLADSAHEQAEAVSAAVEYLKQAQSDLAAQKEKDRQLTQSATTPAKVEEKPVYKKWWFWVAIGGAAAAVATAIAVGVTVGTAGPQEPPRAPFHIAF